MTQLAAFVCHFKRTKNGPWESGVGVGLDTGTVFAIVTEKGALKKEPYAFNGVTGYGFINFDLPEPFKKWVKKKT